MDYIERVNSLRAPRPLTEGLEIDASDSLRVNKAVQDVEHQGFAFTIFCQSNSLTLFVTG